MNKLKELFLENKKYTFKEIKKILNIDEETLYNQLQFLEEQGIIIESNGTFQKIPNNCVVSKIKICKNGCGVFYLDKDKYQIHPNDLNYALNNDLCLFLIDRETKQAKVKKIIKRFDNLVVCEFVNNKFKIYGGNSFIDIPDKETKKLVEGTRVLVKLKNNELCGNIVEIIGHKDDPDIDLKQIALSNSFCLNFSQDAMDELEKIPHEVKEDELKDRLDLRDKLIYTIDCDNTKDMDDAISIELNEKGNYVLGVHISDVSHYIKYGSALFKDAYQRGTSVYMLDSVIPMIHKYLSNGICSLNPNVDRLCMVCQMEIDKEGEILKYKFYPAIMRSHARLTYTEAYKMINEGSVIYEEHKNYINDIKELHNLYKALHKARNRRGAVNAESDEVYFIFNEKLDIVGIDPVVRNDAHMLIEECMIAANICAATYVLEHKNVQTLYRVHAKPPVNKLNQLVASLRSLNLSIRMGTEPSSKDFAKFLKDNANRADSKFLQELILRAMAKAQYSKDNIGHFGLALKNYAHFTSPIRRYADLQLHRVIKYLLKKDKSMSLSKIGERSYSAEELVLLGDKCTKREIAAAEAEYEVVNKLKCKFVKNYEGCITEGTISAIHPFGIFVYLDKFYISGLVHISALSEDRYVKYDDFNNTLNFNGKVYKIGNKIKVTIAAVDIDEQTITLIPVSNKHSKKLANKVIDDTLDTLTKTEAKTKASSISEKLHQSSISEVFDKINKHKKTNAKEAIDLAKQHDSSFINLIKGNN